MVAATRWITLRLYVARVNEPRAAICKIAYARLKTGDYVSLSDSLRARAAGTALLLMDVDGVMTDGKLYHLPREDGQFIEIKGFDSQDGISLQWLQWKGIRTGLISGRVSVGAAERAKQLKMNYVYQGHIEKIPILDEILVDAKLRPEEVAYIGDDLTDIVVMNRVGF